MLQVFNIFFVFHVQLFVQLISLQNCYECYLECNELNALRDILFSLQKKEILTNEI